MNEIPRISSSAAPTAEFDAFAAAHPDVQFVDAIFIDLNGIPRGKRVPIADARKLFEGGVQMPEDIWTLDALGEMTDPLGRGYGDGDPDGTGHPVPGTLVTVGPPPHRRAQVLMTMTGPGGAPCDAEPRQVLAHVLEQFTELRLSPVVACELEFFLIDKNRLADGRPQPPICPTTGERERANQVYSVWDLDRYSVFLDDVAAERARASGCLRRRRWRSTRRASSRSISAMSPTRCSPPIMRRCCVRSSSPSPAPTDSRRRSWPSPSPARRAAACTCI